MLCSSLHEVHTPPALLYIAHRAFSGCTQLSRLVKMEAKATWRGPYVESDTFELCDKLNVPGWINFLPPNQGSSRTFNAEEFDDELRRNLHQQFVCPSQAGTSVSVLQTKSFAAADSLYSVAT